MKIEADTPRDYWAALPDDWRRARMAEIRDFIVARAEGVEEALTYGMLRYGWGEERIVCHLACQVRHVGVYLGDVERLDPSGALSQGYDVGKGCVRLRKSDDIEGLRELLGRKIALREAEA